MLCAVPLIRGRRSPSDCSRYRPSVAYVLVRRRSWPPPGPCDVWPPACQRSHGPGQSQRCASNYVRVRSCVRVRRNETEIFVMLCVTADNWNGPTRRAAMCFIYIKSICILSHIDRKIACTTQHIRSGSSTYFSMSRWRIIVCPRRPITSISALLYCSSRASA